jgi:hypothetical protein
LEALEQRQLMSVFQISGSRDASNPHLYHLALSTDSASMESWTVQWSDGSSLQTVAGDTQMLDHTFADLTDPIITATAVDEAGVHVLALLPADSLLGSVAVTPGQYSFRINTTDAGGIRLKHTNASDAALIANVLSWTQNQVGDPAVVGDGRLLVDVTVPAQGAVELELTPVLQLQQAFDAAAQAQHLAAQSQLLPSCNLNVFASTAASGYVVDEYWQGDGYNVSDLTSLSAYQNGTPDATSTLDSLEFNNPYPLASGGHRVQGLITAPESGYYTFWLSAADSAQLYLSTGENASSAALIASIDAGYGTGFEYFYDQYSSATQYGQIYLEADQSYYFEVLQKNGTDDWGYGHMSVAWADDGNGGTISQQVISGDYLSPYEDSDDGAPRYLTATAYGATAITLTWRGVANNDVHYTITTGSGTPIAEIDADDNCDDGNGLFTYTISGIAPNELQFFNVEGWSWGMGTLSLGSLTTSARTEPLNVWLTSSTTVWEGNRVTLQAACNVYVGSVTYDWNLDGDTNFEISNQTTAVFSAENRNGPSSFPIKVRATVGGASTITNASMSILETPPLATISGATAVNSGETYTLNYTGFVVGTAEGTLGLSGSWGDGSTPDVPNASAPGNITHSYTEGGNYQVWARFSEMTGTWSYAKVGASALGLGTLTPNASDVYSILANQSDPGATSTLTLADSGYFFRMDNQATTHLVIGLNGVITLGEHSWLPQRLYALNRDWVSTDIGSDNGAVLYKFVTDAWDNKYLIIQWTNVRPQAGGAAATFQAVLPLNTATDGVATFNYVSVPATYFAPTDNSWGAGAVGVSHQNGQNDFYQPLGQPWGTGTLTNYAINAEYYLPVAVADFGTRTWPTYPTFTDTTGLQLNGYAAIVDGALHLTTAGLGQRASAYSLQHLNATSFCTDFVVQIAHAQAGEGLAFVLQNSDDSPTIPPLAMGRGSFGTEGLNHCVALTFNPTTNVVGLYVNSVLQASSALTLSDVDLQSGDPLAAHLEYQHDTLTLTLTDNFETFNTVWSVDLASALGDNLAYMGFAAANSGTASQEIQAWTYQSLQTSSHLTVASQGTIVATTSTSVALSTLNLSASDAQGGTDVTYQWLVADNAPGLVFFDDNNSPTANQAVATFASAGTYTLYARLTNASGTSVLSDPMTVSISQVLTTLVVSSTQGAPITTSASQQFSAIALDQFGYPLATPPVFSWSEIGAGHSINSSGLLTASSTIGMYYVTASAQGITSNPVYYNAALSFVSITKQFDASDTSATLQAAATNVCGGTDLTYTWTVTGSNHGAVSLWDSNSATPTALFAAAGTYSFQVTVSDGVHNATGSLNVYVPQIWTSLYVTASDGVPGAGGTQHFNAFVADQFGKSTQLTVGNVNWNLTGSGFTLTTNWTADVTAQTNSGSYRISADYSGLSSAVLAFHQQLPLTAAPSATVSTTTATLSVLGSDPNNSIGEAGLTYMWSAEGPNAIFVSFSDNDENSAKDTTVTFASAGTYKFMVTISNAEGWTTTAFKSVTVGQTLSSLTLTTHDSVPITPNDMQIFTATAYDQFGYPLVSQPASFNWTETASGYYSINSVGNCGTLTATGTASGSYAVIAHYDTINSNPLYFSPAPSVATVANPIVDVSSTSAMLSIRGTDGHGGSDLSYDWTVISGNDTYVDLFDNSDHPGDKTAVFSSAGIYTFLATVSDNVNTPATSSFNVTISQVLTSIVVTPNQTNLVFSGTVGTQSFSATAFDQFGNPMAVQPSFTWSAGGDGNAYSIVATSATSSVLTATTTVGNYVVTVSGGGVTGQPLWFNQGIKLSAVNTTTNSSSAQLCVNATTSGLSGLAYTWTTTSNSPGGVSFSNNGNSNSNNVSATFGAAGTYGFVVTADDGYGNRSTSVAGTYTVPQQLTTIIVTPVGRMTAGVQDFKATALDQFGHAMKTQPNFVWNVTGIGYYISGPGEVTASGMASGSFTVSATANPTKVGTLTLSPSMTWVNSPLASADSAGTFATLSALGTDSSGGNDLIYTWKLINGDLNNVFFSDNGDNSAKNTTAVFAAPGTYQFQVTIKDPAGNSLRSTTSSLTIQSVLTQIDVSTKDSIPLSGQGQHFNALAYNQFGQLMSTQPQFTWRTSGYYTIDSGGNLQLPSSYWPSAYNVWASASGLSNDGTSIVVTGTMPQDALAPVFVTAPASIGGTTTTVNLRATAVDMTGTQDLTYLWSVEGDKPVEFSGQNPVTATFYSAGTYDIVLTVINGRGLSVTKDVTLTVNQTVSHISFISDNPPIRGGEHQPFKVAVADQFGDPISDPTVSWGVQGTDNHVSGSGLIADVTAGTKPGTFTLTAYCGTLSASTLLSVEAEAFPPVLCNQSLTLTSENWYDFISFDPLASASHIDDNPYLGVVTQPAHGFVAGSGHDWYYQLNDAYVGTDSFQIEVRNHNGDSAMETISLTINYTSAKDASMIYVAGESLRINLSDYFENASSCTIESVSDGLSFGDVEQTGSAASLPLHHNETVFTGSVILSISSGSQELGTLTVPVDFIDYDPLFNDPTTFSFYGSSVTLEGANLSVWWHLGPNSPAFFRVVSGTPDVAVHATYDDGVLHLSSDGGADVELVCSSLNIPFTWDDAGPSDRLTISSGLNYGYEIEDFGGTLDINGYGGWSANVSAYAITGTISSDESCTLYANHAIHLDVLGSVCGPIGSAGDIDLTVDGDLLAPMTASGDIRASIIGEMLYPITSTGGSIQLTAGNVLANMSAFTGLYATASFDWGHINGTLISASGGLGVSAPGDITGNLGCGNGWLIAWSQHGNLIGNFSAGGNIARLIAAKSISGTITSAAGYIGQVCAEYGSIDGTITAAQGIDPYDYGLQASVDVSGSISATTGAIIIHAGRNLNASISGGTGYRGVDVQADHDITGVIGAGSIYRVIAGHDITQSITASQQIGTITAGHQILGNISSGGYIDLIAANIDAYYGYGTPYDFAVSGYIGNITITANGTIGTICVFAGVGLSGVINGTTISALGGNIGTITAASGINATISAYGSIGQLNPGAGNLAGSITALNGSLPNIYVDAGSITANLCAKTTIGKIHTLYDIGGTILATGSIVEVVSYLGNITGNIKSVTGNIGNIYAGKDLVGNILAHQNIGKVCVGGTATGSIFAEIGSIGATGSGTSGANTLWPSDGVLVGGDIDNFIASGTGDLKITAHGNINGSVSGNSDVIVMTTGNIASSMVKALLDVSLTADGNISSDVSCFGTVTEDAKGTISGKIVAIGSAISLTAQAINNTDAKGAYLNFDAKTVNEFFFNNELQIADLDANPADLDEPQKLISYSLEAHQQQVWDAFKLLFGNEGQALKKAFVFDGNITFVDQPNDSKGYTLSGSTLTVSEKCSGNYLGGHWWWAKYESLQIDPYTEAQHIYDGLMDALGSRPNMQDRFLEVMRATAPDGLDNIIWAEVEGRQVMREATRRYYDSVVPLIKELASSYFRLVTVFSESANIVVSIGDMLDGDYTAALNLVPLLTKVLKPAGKVLFKAAGRVLEASELNILCANSCFIAGTPVATEDGLRPIETVKANERIWAFDFESKKWSLQPVVEPLKRYFTGKFVRIGVRDDAITCTGTHAFWVTKGQALFDRPVPSDLPENESLWREGMDGGRWVAAQDLQVGDVARLRSGEEASIEEITTWVDSREVFNLWVQHVHSYAVGTVGILVHNDARCAALIEELTTLIRPNARIWNMGWASRGRAAEKAIYKAMGMNQKFSVVNILDDIEGFAKNFPVWDLKKGKNLISIKSCNIYASKTWVANYKKVIEIMGQKGKSVAGDILNLKGATKPDMTLLMIVPKVPPGGKNLVLDELGSVAKQWNVTLLVGYI